MAMTMAPTSSSARSGIRWRGCTDARNRGRSPLPAIANAVRLTPASNESSTPREATVAPIRTAGDSAAHRPPSTTNSSGAGVRASSAAPTAASALIGDRRIDDERNAERERNGARNGAAPDQRLPRRASRCAHIRRTQRRAIPQPAECRTRPPTRPASRARFARRHRTRRQRSPARDRRAPRQRSRAWQARSSTLRNS